MSSILLTSSMSTFEDFVLIGVFQMSSSTSYFYAAIVAIVTIHIILALFIYVAWSEGSKPSAKLE